MRHIGFAYKLLRKGAEYARIFPADNGSPRISTRSSADKKMALSGTFTSTALSVSGAQKEINWYSDEIQPVLLIDKVEYPLGIYIPGEPRESGDDISKFITLDAYDRCARAEEVKTESILHFAKGTAYLNIIKQLLIASGILSVVATPFPGVLQEDREDWDIGTSHLKIINDLLKEINYAPLWFDARGVAVLRPKVAPSARTIDHILSDKPRAPGVEKIERLLPGYSRRTNAYSAPNVFICICSNPDKDGVMFAISENDNPSSPISTVSRGRRICQKVQINNVESQEALQQFADNMRDESMTSSETYTVTTALLPGWGVSDVTAIHYKDIDEICTEESWSMELAVGGVMTHELRKVAYNLG